MVKVHRPKFSGKKQLNCLRKVRPVNKGLSILLALCHTQIPNQFQLFFFRAQNGIFSIVDLRRNRMVQSCKKTQSQKDFLHRRK